MADSKLSDLPQGTVSKLYYGTQLGSSASAKFFDTGIYNVKNYGAKGDGIQDDVSAITNAIQAALTSSQVGGTVYFPPGNYKVDSPIILNSPDVTGSVHLLGSSPGNFNSEGGSTIFGNISAANGGYILAIGSGPGPGPANRVGNTLIQSISYLNFVNNHTPTPGSVVSTEPASGGCGCIYMTAGIGVTINDCNISINGGFGLFSACQNVALRTTNIYGFGSGGTNSLDSWGVFSNSINISDCKIAGLGVGVLASSSTGAGFMARNIDFEVCGCGIALGVNIPFEYYIFGTGASGGIVAANQGGFISEGTIESVSMESIGDTDHSGYRAAMVCGNVINLTVKDCTFGMFGQVGNADYGLNIIGPTVHSEFSNIIIFGGADVALFNPGGAVGCIFRGIQVNKFHAISNVGLDWLPPTPVSANNDGVGFEYCALGSPASGLNPGLLISNLPQAPGAIGQKMLCTDSNDLPWNTAGGTSNIGKPAGHTFTTNAASSAGSTSISFSSAPAWFTGTMMVADVNNPTVLAPGTTGTVSGTSINLNYPVGNWLWTMQASFGGDKNLYFREIPSWLTGTPVVFDCTLAAPNSFPVGTTITNISSNMNLVTSAGTAAGTNVLHFANPLPAWMTIGLPAFDVTTPTAIQTGGGSNTVVQSFVSGTPSTVTLYRNIQGTVSGGDTISFGGGGVVTLSNPTGFSATASAPTASGNDTLHLGAGAAPAWMAIGLTIVDYSQLYFATPAIPGGTTVLNFTSSPFTVTMSVNAAGSGIATGDVINFSNLVGVGHDLISFALGSGVGNGDTIVFFKGYTAGDATGPYTVQVKWNGAYWEIA